MNFNKVFMMSSTIAHYLSDYSYCFPLLTLAQPSWPPECSSRCSRHALILHGMLPLPGMPFHLILTMAHPSSFENVFKCNFLKKAYFDHCILNCLTASLRSPYPAPSHFLLLPFNKLRNLIFIVFLSIFHLLLFLHFYYVVSILCILFPQKWSGISICVFRALRGY